MNKTDKALAPLGLDDPNLVWCIGGSIPKIASIPKGSVIAYISKEAAYVGIAHGTGTLDDPVAVSLDWARGYVNAKGKSLYILDEKFKVVEVYQ